MSEVRSRLEILLAGAPHEVSAALHESVVFVQADGTRWEGRAAVLEVFANSESEVVYRALEWADEALAVALTVPGIPGELRIRLRGRCEGGALVWVTVEA